MGRLRQKYLKRGETSRKKCNTIQEKLKVLDSGTRNTERGAAGEDAEQLPGHVSRSDTKSRSSNPGAALPSTWQISAVCSLKECSGPGTSSGGADKGQVLVLIPGCAIH